MGFSIMSKPPTLTVPEVGGMNPVIIRIEVDFPAPFGPRKPSTSPRSTENDTPSTARFGPNVFTKFSTLIMRFIQIPIGVGGPDTPFPPACKVIYHRQRTPELSSLPARDSLPSAAAIGLL